ncbi:NAD(P)/FAD-dependent oxidoreductase [Acetobacter aceti]|uniref:Pyridine nucleotide-disulfide oxidoreductase n=1 Tax=Acetobacter aceti TaxID=435 RepID=A0A6S6PQD3_ACEAC|nr:FAD/NAD(P)-binding oxidoreductase [Acetobacter aceti]BCI68911.1 pyridine nucleotide-disulfide oxidoreductase [Acetobacter aceti]
MTQATDMRPSVPMDADIIIVGCGPAGMTAAIELAEANCSVIVLDMQPTPGGQIFRNLEDNISQQSSDRQALLAALGPAYRAGADLIRRFRACSRIDYRPQTTVWEVRPDGTVGWLRGMDAGYLRATTVILAHGAMERPVPFPGWTLPGVMTAGAVQTLLKAGNLKPTGNVILAGTGPLLLLLATQLHKLGVKPTLIARTDRFSDGLRAMRHLRRNGLLPVVKGLGWLAQLKRAGIPMVSGLSDLSAEGERKVEAVSFTVKGRRVSQACHLLVVHDGIVPAIDIPNGAGLALQWDPANASWRPRTTLDGLASSALPPDLQPERCAVRITGDARRIGGAEAAIAHGRLTAQAILAELGKGGGISCESQQAVDRTLSVRPFLDAAFPPGLSATLPDDNTIVCRCEELTAGTLREKIRAGFSNMDALRGETRCGMGPCQGRNCMITAARLIGEDHGACSPTLPVFRGRPPIRPLPLGALAGLTGLDPSATELLTLEDKPEHDVEATSDVPAE